MSNTHLKRDEIIFIIFFKYNNDKTGFRERYYKVWKYGL